MNGAHPLLYLGALVILVAQAVAIATWWALSRMTLERISERSRLFVPFFLTFGMAAAFRFTSLGRAIAEAEPQDGPVLQRRFRRAVLATLVGVLIAFAGLAS